MHTPTQLRDRLLELGIDRDLRTLTDWRQKGLLPQLQSVSSGRGRGVKRYWNDEVLDQAIAVDWLMKRCGHADETLFGLWLAGYLVDPIAAQRAWIEELKRVQHRRQQAASRFSGRFTGLGRNWWNRLKSHVAFTLPWWRELRDSDRENISKFLGDTEEWLRDDEERDDDAYRYAIADVVIGLMKIDPRAFYNKIDQLWPNIDPASLFAVTPSIEFIESMSLPELEAAQRSIVSVAFMLRHVAELENPTASVASVIAPLLFMRDFLGTLIAKLVIKVNREIPELPVEQTISTLRDLVMSVQSIDIISKSDGGILFSEGVGIEWEATKKKLEQLWSKV